MRLQPVGEVEYQDRRDGYPGDDQESSNHLLILPPFLNNNKWSLTVSQYHQDLLVLMTWAVSTLGALFVGLAVWGGRKVLARLDSIEEMLASEVKAINSMLHQHEIRLVKIESSCLHYHGAAVGHPPRRSDEVQRVAFPDYPD